MRGLTASSLSIRAGHALAVLTGAMVPLGFAPFGWYPLVILAIAGLLFLVRDLPPGPAFQRGWWFGVGMFAVGVSWVMVSVHVYGQALLAVAILVMLLFVMLLALFPAFSTWAVSRGTPGAGLPRYLLAFPAAWIFFEWVRGWLFTGFPWLELGYSQIDSPLAQYAPLTGVYGVGLLTLVSGGSLYGVIASAGRARATAAALLFLIWSLPLGLDYRHWQSPAGDPLQVALVQGSIPQQQKWEAELQQETLRIYRELSEPHWDADIMVWPETAIPMFYEQVEDTLIPALQQRAVQTDTGLLVGVPILERQDWQVFNSVLALGETRVFYRKRHLVPFGEYLPLRRYIDELLAFLVIPLGDFTPGDIEQPLQEVAGYAVGTSVCYEVAFGRDINLALPAAALLVNVSNDGWFGDSLAPHQHLEMARMRALETGRYLLRATNTGISAVIDSGGGIVASSKQFEPAVVRATITPLTGTTPYVRMGNGPVVVACLLLFGLGVFFGGFGERFLNRRGSEEKS